MTKQTETKTTYLIQTSSDGGKGWRTYGIWVQRTAAFRNFERVSSLGSRARMSINGRVAVTTHLEDAEAQIEAEQFRKARRALRLLGTHILVSTVDNQPRRAA